jgi:single-strand DNA-binding protein
MNHLNSILLEGNLVGDPQLKTTPQGTRVCTFSVASNRFFPRQDSSVEKEVSYFEVETLERCTETCHQQGRKGRGVRVVGRLKQERLNGQDGKAYAKIIIIAEHVEFRPEWGLKPASEAAPHTDEDIPF